MLAPAAPPLAAAPPPTVADGRGSRTAAHFLPAPVVLGGVTWDDYLRFGDDPENAGLRLTYDAASERLEIEVPGEDHERTIADLSVLIATFARLKRIVIKSYRGTRWRRAGIGGAEGDEAYYISRVDQVRGRRGNIPNLDAGAIPPDLVVEVDVTNPGVAKLPIYAGIGVPEVWIWDDDLIVVRRLGPDGYRIVDASVELPGFPVSLAADLIAAMPDAGTIELEDAFAERLRDLG